MPRSIIDKIQTKNTIRLYDVLAFWPAIVKRRILEHASQSPPLVKDVDMLWFFTLT